jgi:polysaccharide pyruvyl transferase WcaK-like protein
MMDHLLGLWVASLIEHSKIGWVLGKGSRWKPGRPLRLLFAGYNGTRNTGADVRVHEMLRQVEHILGSERFEPHVLTQDPGLTRGYFKSAHQLRLPDIFPPFLHRAIPLYDGVVACEGSMFKSKFANALSMMMIEALGMAAVQNKLSVGYGAEAGNMDSVLRRLCRRYCGKSLVITRNEQSRQILRGLGVPTELGTDTAWTFEPHDAAYGRRTLRQLGWDGRRPVLAVCPINPYWWPVKPSLAKAAARAICGAYKRSQYRSFYFHQAGPQVDGAFHRYLDAIAGAVGDFRRRHAVMIILVAMEALDTRACHELSQRLGRLPVISSRHFDMYELVGLLRCCDLLLSSRYHAIVTSMPAKVPSAGITMDERISNLMEQRGHQHLLASIDDPDLQPRILQMLESLLRDREAIAQAVGRTVTWNLKEMARMGVYFEEQVQQRYPEFEIRGGIRGWEDYLPPLSPTLHGLLEEHAA